MACVSSLALVASFPTVGRAQSTDTGAPGKALTTGTVTSAAGTVTDGGPNGGVAVQPGFNDTVTVNNATIATQTAVAGLNVQNNLAAGSVDVVLRGSNSISGATGIQVITEGAVTLDLSAGGSSITGGAYAGSLGGSVTLVNGANTFLPSSNAALTAESGNGANAVVNSVGGSITGPGGGIFAETSGGGSGAFSGSTPGGSVLVGNIVIGQGLGVTTAFDITGSTSSGISADAVGSVTITTGAGGTIDGGHAGISATGAGPITLNVGAAIGANSAPQIGIDAEGGAAITLNLGATVAGAVTGVNATSTGVGIISIDSTAAISGGSGAGIQAASAGSIQIGAANAPLGGAVTGGTNGIAADAATSLAIYAGQVNGGTNGVSAISQGFGNVVVSLAGPVSAANGDGVLVMSGSPPANDVASFIETPVPFNISISTKGVSAANGSGVFAVNDTSGSIFITTTGAVSATGAPSLLPDGIFASTNFVGPGVIDIDALAPVSGVRAGIEAAIDGRGSNINILAPTSVTGAAGIIATNLGDGGVTIGSASSPVGPVTGSNGAGIYVSSAGGPIGIYATSVTSMGGGPAQTGGAPPAPLFLSPSYGYAIGTQNQGLGTTTIDVTGPVVGGMGGIFATGQTGALTINAGGSITTGGLGIFASTGGAVTVAIGGAVSSVMAPAIVLNSGGSATVAIGPGASVIGTPTGASQGVITLETQTGHASTITIGQGAIVRSTAGSNGTAIYASGGSVTVDDAGLLMGGVNFSGVATPNTAVLNIESGGVFVMSGANVFASPASLVNAGGVLAATGPLTTLAFTGGPSSYTSAGTLQVGLPGETDSSSLVVTGVSTFINAGVVSLVNGRVGDSLVIPGAAYVGAPGAKFEIDTAVGTPGGKTGAASDTLTIGTSSGVTSVVIHDVSGGFGAYNPGGIPIVIGATHPGDFVLDPASSYYAQTGFGPVIDKPGLFFSQLAVTPGATVLVSAPKVEAFQFSTLASQIESLWYADTARADRQTDLRDQLATGDPALSGHPTVWAKVDGAVIDRSDIQNYTAGPASYRYDASYNQDVEEFSFGIDGAQRTGQGGGATYGVYAGYVGSETRFTVDSTQTLVNGWSLNSHAGYSWPNGLFVNAQVGADWFIAKLKAPDLEGFSNPHTNIAVWGASVESGRRWTLAPGLAIEPSVSVAYMDGVIDTPPASIGAAFQFSDPQSLRVGAGFRLIGSPAALSSGWSIRYAASARLEDDLLASNRTTLLNAGPDFVDQDSFAKVFAEAGGNVIADGPGGWSVSAGLRGRWNDRYSEAGANAAVKLRF